MAPLLAPGHTPGHTCWRVSQGRDAFLCWGDLIHLSDVQIAQPDATLAYDIDKAKAVHTRRRFLEMVADEGLAIAGAHVNAPGFGRVTRRGAGFAFEPDR